MEKISIKKYLLYIINPYKKKFSIIFILMFFSSGISFILPQITKEIMDNGFIAGDFNTVIHLSIGMLFIVLIHQFIEFIKEMYRTDLKKGLVYSLYQRAFIHVCKSQLKYLGRNNSELLNKLHTDISAIASIADNTTFFVITQIFNVCGGIVGLFMIQKKMAILVLLFVPIKYFLVLFLAKKKELLTTSLIKANAKFSKWFENTIAGIEEIKLFNLLEQKLKEFMPLQDNVINLDKNIMMLFVYNNIFDHLLIEILTVIIYIIGVIYVLDASLTIGSIFAFITYLIYVSAPISAIINVKYMVAGITPSFHRFVGFINTPEENLEGKNITFKENVPIIEFYNVSFSYPDSKVKVLEKIDFKILLGQKVAIVGKNGIGKSTLTKLMFRFYSPTDGYIKIYGEKIDVYKLSEVRSLFSVVSQNIYLFEASIKYNIILNKKYDPVLFSKVVKVANLDGMIEKYSCDYNVGCGGSNLSGGQKQKIALARALYFDNNVFIFDETTANLDVQTKGLFQNLLCTYLREKTVIIITHDSSLLEHMDQIIYLV